MLKQYFININFQIQIDWEKVNAKVQMEKDKVK